MIEALANRQPIGASCRQVATCRVTVSEAAASLVSAQPPHPSEIACGFQKLVVACSQRNER